MKIFGNRNLLLLFAAIILTCWAIGFFIYSVGAIIHTLLIVAVISIVLKMRRKKNIIKTTHVQKMTKSNPL